MVFAILSLIATSIIALSNVFGITHVTFNVLQPFFVVLLALVHVGILCATIHCGRKYEMLTKNEEIRKKRVKRLGVVSLVLGLLSLSLELACIFKLGSFLAANFMFVGRENLKIWLLSLVAIFVLLKLPALILTSVTCHSLLKDIYWAGKFKVTKGKKKQKNTQTNNKDYNYNR